MPRQQHRQRRQRLRDINDREGPDEHFAQVSVTRTRALCSVQGTSVLGKSSGSLGEGRDGVAHAGEGEDSVDEDALGGLGKMRNRI